MLNYGPELWQLPNIINQAGRYITRRGEIVTIDAIAGGSCLGAYADGTRDRWHRTGRIFPRLESPNDIIRAVTD